MVAHSAAKLGHKEMALWLELTRCVFRMEFRPLRPLKLQNFKMEAQNRRRFQLETFFFANSMRSRSISRDIKRLPIGLLKKGHRKTGFACWRSAQVCLCKDRGVDQQRFGKALWLGDLEVAWVFSRWVKMPIVEDQWKISGRLVEDQWKIEDSWNISGRLVEQ